MFSDRFWALKALAALAALVVLGHELERRTSEAEPSVHEVLADPSAHRGEPVWLGPWKVAQTSPDGFVLARKRTRIPVLATGPGQPAIGDWVRVRGRWWEGGVVRAEEVRVAAGYPWRRAVIYGYSIVAALFLLALVARSHEWRWRPPMLAARQDR